MTNKQINMRMGAIKTKVWILNKNAMNFPTFFRDSEDRLVFTMIMKVSIL